MASKRARCTGSKQAAASVKRLAAQLPTGYAQLFQNIKARIRTAQIKAALSVNRELILLYWDIGRSILESQRREGWGAKIVERLGHDLHREFPDLQGFSRANLLFYHLRLRCYVVIDLKTEEFKPEFAGKMNFYLSAVDDQLRHPDDKPSIGLLLCKTKQHLSVEYALRDLHKPIGVAEWQTRLVESLPKELKGSLPTVEELETELTGRKGTRQ